MSIERNGAGVRDALAVLSAVVNDLASAMEAGEAEAVLAVEPRLVAALDAARLSAADGGEPVADLAAQIRDGISRCRRLGGTVPALLSVMFPGQVGYGPAVGVQTALRVPGALVKVI